MYLSSTTPDDVKDDLDTVGNVAIQARGEGSRRGEGRGRGKGEKDKRQGRENRRS